MKKTFITLLINAASLFIIDQLFTGISLPPRALIIMSVVLWLLNGTVRPVLKVLTLPVSVLTLGIFSLVVNAFVLWLAFKFVPGAYFNSFGTIFIASLVLAVLNTGLHAVLEAK